MGVPPEVAFERFFQKHFPYVPPLRPEDPDPRIYKGRHDLTGLRPSLQEQLRSIQKTFNDALQNEKQGVASHVDHPPFHVDYVDSSVQNAIAFRHDDHSFIAITVPLIFAVSDVCLCLSKSPRLAAFWGVRPSDDEYNELQAVLFLILADFIVAHEWTHHVHGHTIQQDTSPNFRDEIRAAGSIGSFEAQIEEVAADGYAVYHVLANIMDSPTRPMLLAHLKLDTAQPHTQDEVLFSLFVVAVGAYLLVRPVADLMQINIYEETHPPQAARLNFLMHEAVGWCRQNRPRLEGWIKQHFRDLFNAAAEVTLGEAGTRAWKEQTAFFKTEEGNKYTTAVGRAIDAYRDALGNRRA